MAPPPGIGSHLLLLQAEAVVEALLLLHLGIPEARAGSLLLRVDAAVVVQGSLAVLPAVREVPLEALEVRRVVRGVLLRLLHHLHHLHAVGKVVLLVLLRRGFLLAGHLQILLAAIQAVPEVLIRSPGGLELLHRAQSHLLEREIHRRTRMLGATRVLFPAR